jgi:hypothetical protein
MESDFAGTKKQAFSPPITFDSDSAHNRGGRVGNTGSHIIELNSSQTPGMMKSSHIAFSQNQGTMTSSPAACSGPSVMIEAFQLINFKMAGR